MQKPNTQPYAIEPRRSIDLTLSENPLGCSSVVSEILGRDLINQVPSYPSSNGRLLKIELAKKFGGKPSNYFVSNGSENIILNIPRILVKAGSTVIIPQLSFPLFALYSQFARLKVEFAPMKGNLGISLAACEQVILDSSGSISLIFLCNPNNPTGMILSKSEISDFLDRVPKKTIVIIDEANIDFGGESVIDQAFTRNNVLILRTFSKGFGLAGMRVGFAVGDPELISQLTSQTQPFPITTLSEQMAIAALSDVQFVETSKQYINKERKFLKRELKKLGCTIFDSQANNIFVQLPNTVNPTEFFEALTTSDVSVVKGSRFAGFDDQFFRVSPRNQETNQKFINIVQTILKQ